MNMYLISYTKDDGETVGYPEYSCSNEVEAALWFAYEFADELDGEIIDPKRLSIEQVGYTFYGENDTYDYRGSYNPNDCFCEIKWSYADLMCLMAERNIPVTDENIKRLKKNGFERGMREVSIQYGWEILGTIVDDVFN